MFKKFLSFFQKEKIPYFFFYPDNQNPLIAIRNPNGNFMDSRDIFVSNYIFEDPVYRIYVDVTDEGQFVKLTRQDWTAKASADAYYMTLKEIQRIHGVEVDWCDATNSYLLFWSNTKNKYLGAIKFYY